MAKTRIGKKLHRIEKLFAKLPKAHRTVEVFTILCEAGGVNPEKAREHFTLLLAMLGAQS